MSLFRVLLGVIILSLLLARSVSGVSVFPADPGLAGTVVQPGVAV